MSNFNRCEHEYGDGLSFIDAVAAAGAEQRFATESGCEKSSLRAVGRFSVYVAVLPSAAIFSETPTQLVEDV